MSQPNAQKCPECKGTGKVVLLTSIKPCTTCAAGNPCRDLDFSALETRRTSALFPHVPPSQPNPVGGLIDLPPRGYRNALEREAATHVVPTLNGGYLVCGGPRHGTFMECVGRRTSTVVVKDGLNVQVFYELRPVIVFGQRIHVLVQSESRDLDDFYLRQLEKLAMLFRGGQKWELP